MWTYHFETHRKINIDGLSMFYILKYDIYKKIKYKENSKNVRGIYGKIN